MHGGGGGGGGGEECRGHCYNKVHNLVDCGPAHYTLFAEICQNESKFQQTIQDPRFNKMNWYTRKEPWALFV